ncbi:hypothetical protein D3C78_479120 [compost metagenome]
MHRAHLGMALVQLTGQQRTVVAEVLFAVQQLMGRQTGHGKQLIDHAQVHVGAEGQRRRQLAAVWGDADGLLQRLRPFAAERPLTVGEVLPDE